MNTILFLSGAGIGTLVATAIMLAIMFRAVGAGHATNREQVQKQHEELIALRRDELTATDRIAKALEAIAQTQGA